MSQLQNSTEHTRPWCSGGAVRRGRSCSQLCSGAATRIQHSFTFDWHQLLTHGLVSVTHHAGYNINIGYLLYLYPCYLSMGNIWTQREGLNLRISLRHYYCVAASFHRYCLQLVVSCCECLSVCLNAEEMLITIIMKHWTLLMECTATTFICIYNTAQCLENMDLIL